MGFSDLRTMRLTRFKIGDVYELSGYGSEAYFFQHFGNDETMLGSDVIRVFQGSHNSGESIDLLRIVNSPVLTHLHTTLRFGVKDGSWKRIGHAEVAPGANECLFRMSSDYGSPAVRISREWYVWRMNEPLRYVGPLPPEYQTAELGVVFSTMAIRNRVVTGNFQIVHPHPDCGMDPTILPIVEKGQQSQIEQTLF
jgi:hypothetical protein